MEALQVLLERAEVNHAAKNGFTALYGACRNGHVEAIRALVEAGADLSRADNNGFTPLSIARANNHEAAVQALVEAGATV